MKAWSKVRYYSRVDNQVDTFIKLGISKGLVERQQQRFELQNAEQQALNDLGPPLDSD